MSGKKYKEPISYDPPVRFEKMLQEKDIMVPMRDGGFVCIDVYRPDTTEMLPSLLAFAPHNKDLQAADISGAIPPQPSWSHFWQGAMEAGDSEFLVSRGYIHVIGNPRGNYKSSEWLQPGPPPATDAYDLIEWIAKQPWCDGNIGMIGLSAFGQAQLAAAATNPPHLKAIFPFDPAAAYHWFRELNPGGVIHGLLYLLDHLNVAHGKKSMQPTPLPPPLEKLWQSAMQNMDYKMYTHIYNLLTQRGEAYAMLFLMLLDPFEPEGAVEEAIKNFENIKIPVYTGTGQYSYAYKMHLQGAQHWYESINVPKKIMFRGPSATERPFHEFHDEILKWYDYWLKGIDTGIMDEPPVKYWTQGENKWRYADDWPIPGTQWMKFYLHSWERLRTESIKEYSREGYKEPDTFVQMPPTQTNEIQKLRYMTEPLAEDTLIAGPISMNFFASIDQEDTNWIIVLKDVGPDVSVRTGRPDELKIPELPEREITRGWLKASYRELDKERSMPQRPWHKLTKEAHKPVVPGEISEYNVEVLSACNMFLKGHRICVDITCLDLPTGTGGAHDIEYAPYHICSSKTVVHNVYHNAKYPSHLLLPIIPHEKD